MSSEVYVVTSTELGWDCVVGVFNSDSVTEEQLEKIFPQGSCYVISHMLVNKDTHEFED